MEYVRINPQVAKTKGNIFIPQVGYTHMVAIMYSANTMETVALSWKNPDEIEEEEWKALVAQPEMQRGFSRLADKIRADIAAGKFEEGGFAVE